MKVENYDKIVKKYGILHLIASGEDAPIVNNLLEEYNIEKIFNRMYQILAKYKVSKKYYYDMESDIADLISDAYSASLIDLACSDIKVVY